MGHSADHSFYFWLCVWTLNPTNQRKNSLFSFRAKRDRILRNAVCIWCRPDAKVVWHCAWKPDTRHFNTPPSVSAHLTGNPSPHYGPCLIGPSSLCASNQSAARRVRRLWKLSVLTVMSSAMSQWWRGGGRMREDDVFSDGRGWLDGAVHERGGAENPAAYRQTGGLRRHAPAVRADTTQTPGAPLPSRLLQLREAQCRPWVNTQCVKSWLSFNGSRWLLPCLPWIRMANPALFRSFLPIEDRFSAAAAPHAWLLRDEQPVTVGVLVGSLILKVPVTGLQVLHI